MNTIKLNKLPNNVEAGFPQILRDVTEFYFQKIPTQGGATPRVLEQTNDKKTEVKPR